MTTAATASSPPGQGTLLSKLRIVAGDIKLAHSVFALPFAILAAFLARPESAPWSRFARQLVLVVVCMVLARSWAMLFNRISDRALDAANPRTARRALAAGKLTMRDGWLIALACAIGFVIACALFFVFFGNFWPLVLSVPVLGWIAFYSLTKRFTALCHVFLGGALAASPLAAALAVHPPALMSMPVLWLLSGMVLLWVAGFDVIYALQDLEFDRAVKLHSIPAKMGVSGAMWISRALHVGAFAMLVLAASPIGRESRFGPMFLIAAGLVGVLLVCEHVVLARRGQAGLDMAFFTLNGIVSCVLGAAGVADVLL